MIVAWWRDPHVALYLTGVLAVGAHLADKHLELRQWTTSHHTALFADRASNDAVMVGRAIAAAGSTMAAFVRPLLRLPPSVAEVNVVLRTRVRAGVGEAGQGCVDWPAGRVLLQWCLDGGVPLKGANVLEIGAGVGLASIGLAQAAIVAQQPLQRQSTATAAVRGTSHTSGPTTVVAADVCLAALANLRINAANNLGSPSPIGGSISRINARGERNSSESNAVGSVFGQCGVLHVLNWNAAGGAAAVAALASAGVKPEALTHVIGADLASMPSYHAGLATAGTTGSGAAEEASMQASVAHVADPTRGLEPTLAALLTANPKLVITLLLVDRRSAAAVAALAQAVAPTYSSSRSALALPQQGELQDPSLMWFAARCEALGLTLERRPVPPDTLARVAASQVRRPDTKRRLAPEDATE